MRVIGPLQRSERTPATTRGQAACGRDFDQAASCFGRPAGRLAVWSMFVYPPEEKCQGILVGSNGRRFQNESDYGAVGGHRQVYELDGIACNHR